MYIHGLAGWLLLLPLWVYLKWVDILPGPETILKELWLVSLLIPAAVIFQRNDYKIKLPVVVVVFTAIIFVTVARDSLLTSLRFFRPYFEPIALIFLPITIVRLHEEETEYLLRCLLWAIVLICGIAVIHLVYSEFLLWDSIVRTELYRRGPPYSWFGPHRLMSITGNPNNLANLAVFGTILGVWEFEQRDSLRAKIIFTVVIGLTAAMVFLSVSRDDFGILAIAFVAMALLQRRWRLLIGGGLVMTSGFFMNIDKIIRTIRILVENGNPRFNFWANIITYLNRDLITGIGPAALAIQGWYIDSSLLNIIIEMGIIGLLIFLLLNIQIARSLVSLALNGDQLSVVLVTLTGALFGTMLMRQSLINTPFSLLYWLFVAMSYQRIFEASSGLSGEPVRDSTTPSTKA
ncbi:hypothetical protein C463_14980 [Halorubrum californiense DSM 19288]|uniref:Uncharacterized protein n=1 Tax=Halorubrum californiense DSM 19288 TaxID=1227465 RepID=M0E0C2_9EURY|nr:hypothetical protein C463_14980 [Halorubrum californiense DSM 19288]